MEDPAHAEGKVGHMDVIPVQLPIWKAVIANLFNPTQPFYFFVLSATTEDGMATQSTRRERERDIVQ